MKAPARPGLAPGDPRAAFLQRVVASLADDSFARLVLSSPTPAAQPVERLLARRIDLSGGPALSVTSREPRRDTVRNLPLAEVQPWLDGELGTRFAAALLETTAGDWQLSLAAGRTPRLVRHRARNPETPTRQHDRPRQHALGDSARDWLAGLGIVDASGKVLPRFADKHQQVQRYGDILRDLVRDTPLPDGAPVWLADMGCGRGYLTFAAWQLLRRDLALDARVVGVEARPELVQAANQLARRLHLEGLSFVSGHIGEVPLPGLDVLVALHACDTATDDAILRGVRGGARLILVAPCCQQEVLPQLRPAPPLEVFRRHGLLAGRLADLLTDTLRALVLEAAGFDVRLLEFVAGEHTPKNLLIAAVRRREPFRDAELLDHIASLKASFGVRHHALDPLLPPA